MTDNNIVSADIEQAKTAATAAACTDNEGRTTLHSILESTFMLGADWDLSDVLDAIDQAEGVYWFDDFMGHDLAVITADHRACKFEVKRPSPEAAA